MDGAFKSDVSNSDFVHLYIPGNKKNEANEVSVDIIRSSAKRSTLFYDEEINVYVELALKDNKDFQLDDLEYIHTTVNVIVSGQLESATTTIAAASNLSKPISKVASSNAIANANGSKEFEIVTKVATKENLIHSCADYAIWHVPVLIRHPRVRLVDPVVTITAVVSLDKHSLKEAMIEHEKTSEAASAASREAFFFNGIDPIEDFSIFRPLLGTGIKAIKHRPTVARSKSTNDSTSDSTKAMSKAAAAHELDSSKKSPHAAAVSGEDSFATTAKPGTANITSQSSSVTKCIGKAQIPVQPALNLRIVSLSPQGKPDKTVTLLEISVPEKSKYKVSVSKVELKLFNEPAPLLGDIEFPLILCPGELYLMSYSLVYADVTLSALRRKAVTISSESSPVIDEDNMKSGPLISTKWETVVDLDSESRDFFSSSSNPKSPGSGMMLSSPLQPSGGGSFASATSDSRSSSMNNNNSRKLGGFGLSGYKASRNSSATSLLTSTSMGQPHPDSLKDVSISFSGPSSVRVGEKFFWKVFVVNKSSATKHLSLYFQSTEPIQKNNKVFADRLVNTYSSSTDSGSNKLGLSIDRTTLRKLAAHTTLPDTGIISLVNDVRIGPLDQDASYETSIELLALAEGLHTLEGVIVVDLDSSEGHECGKLLEILVTN